MEGMLREMEGNMQGNKLLGDYLSLPYTLILYPDSAAGGWVMEIKELPGCFSQADTWDEILPMMDDAKRLWLETALDHGIQIPEPEPRSEASTR